MKNIFLIFVFVFFTSNVFSQQITYSVPENEDMRSLNFDIIGKINGNYLVYKEVRNKSYIHVYDNDMKVIDRVDLTFMPDRILKTDFIVYPDFAWLIYQYQKRNIVY